MGNMAGVASPFLFASSTAPASTPGYSTLIGMLGFGMCMVASLHLWYRFTNKRRDQGKEDWKLEGKTEEEVAEMGEDSPRFRYTV